MVSFIRRFLVFAVGLVLLFIFVGGVIPALRKLASRFSADSNKTHIIQQIVGDTKGMLPTVTDKGLVRVDALEDEHGALVWRNTLLTYTAAEIDPIKMQQVLKERALHRVDAGEKLSRVVLMGIPLKYVYGDRLGQQCVTFDVRKDDLILFRRQRLQGSGPVSPTTP